MNTASYNTPGNTTSFINSQSGGLWLKAGTILRGLEANSNGSLSNNGGTLHLYAPDNVVRIDGNIDVSAIHNCHGAYLGNGGKVFIDSGYLFQNGNIFANGSNGGLVQVNVGGMTLGNGAQIQAKGSTGAGGVVAINASDPVDLRRGSVIDTSGRVVGSFDTNLINIEGSLVRIDGNLQANGVASGSRGGTIRLVATGQIDMQDLKTSLQAATVGSKPTLTSQERTFLLQRTASLSDGSVVIAKDSQQTIPQYIGNLSANGTTGNIDSNNDRTQHTNMRSGDGGTILLTAINDVLNQGKVTANGANGSSHAQNGGDGGTINTMSMVIDNQQGQYSANGGAGNSDPSVGGIGGNGGLLAFHYREMHNIGGIYADGGVGGSSPKPGAGGNGGLVMLSGSDAFLIPQIPQVTGVLM